MPTKKYSELAELCEQAIVDLLSHSIASYSIAGRSFTRLNINDLVKLQAYYEDKAKAEAAGGGFITIADMRARGGGSP